MRDVSLKCVSCPGPFFLFPVHHEVRRLFDMPLFCYRSVLLTYVATSDGELNCLKLIVQAPLPPPQRLCQGFLS